MPGPVIKVEFKLVLPEQRPAPLEQENKWGDTLILDAMLINERRKTSVTSANWGAKFAGPSSLGYQGFVKSIDPNYITRKGRKINEVVQIQAEKMDTAYDKWNKGLDHVFAEDGKKFKESVKAKKANWSKGISKTTLRVTGDKVWGIGAGPIACYMLTGDPRAEGFFREGDELIKGPAYDVSKNGQQNQYRNVLENQLVRAARTIIASKFAQAQFDQANEWACVAANALRDPAKANEFVSPDTPGKSFLGFILESGIFKLHGRVEK